MSGLPGNSIGPIWEPRRTVFSYFSGETPLKKKHTEIYIYVILEFLGPPVLGMKGQDVKVGRFSSSFWDLKLQNKWL